jgi:hypothetical protein
MSKQKKSDDATSSEYGGYDAILSQFSRQNLRIFRAM